MQTETGHVPTSQMTNFNSVMRYRGPIWMLLILAPVIGEVLSGSTRLSFLFVLIPEVMVWGGGALLCRELARRWRAGAVSLLLLGLALSIAEEFIIQQTSLAPLPFPGANAAFARYAGVNWVYLLFMLGYESVWVVLVPVKVTELLFPSRAQDRWLRTRGLIVTCIVFLVGCRIAWYGWTQQALKRMNVAPYHPPMFTIAWGAAAIVLLIWWAYLLRSRAHAGSIATRKAPNPWIPGIAAFVFSSAWWLLMVQIFSPHPTASALVVLAVATIWALLALSLFWYWSTGVGWSQLHGWAAAFGATLSCMLPGYLSLAGWTRPDLLFKIFINVAVLAGFVILLRRIRGRNPDLIQST